MVAFVHLGFETFTQTRSNLMSLRSVTYHLKLSISRYFPDITSVSGSHVTQICYQCHWIYVNFCTFRFWDIHIGQIECYVPSICYLRLEMYYFRYLPDTTSVSGSYVTQIFYQCHQINDSFSTFRFWDIHIGQIESYELTICYMPLEIVHFPVFAGHYFRKRKSRDSNLLPVSLG